MKTRIIGIDPGLTKTGWGIIEVINNCFKFIASDTIRTNPDQPMTLRLKELHDKLTMALELYKPDCATIEETFINSNPLSSLKLGHARGSLMLTLAIYKIPVAEYSTTSIKKAISGVGRAQKQQVDRMIKILLPQSTHKSEDEADALAAAICHANNQRNY